MKKLLNLQVSNEDRSALRISTIFIGVLIVFLSGCREGSILQPPGDATDQGNTVLPSGATPVQPASVSLAPPDTDHTSDHLTQVTFTDSNSDIWPPQPQNISNVNKLQQVTTAQNDSPEPVYKSARKDAEAIVAKARRILLNDEIILAALGNHYAVLASHNITDKSGNVTQVETEFFIYNTNKVLTAVLKPDSTPSVSYTLIDASTYQPPESQQEVSRAISLASTALEQQGFTGHKQFVGTALLAYPNAAEVAESGTPFFSTRKLYVTFGPGQGEAPHYRALVNLSSLNVEHSGAMQ